MGMGNKSADLVPQTFIMRIGWNVRVCNKNADHADLFASPSDVAHGSRFATLIPRLSLREKNGRNSAPFGGR